VGCGQLTWRVEIRNYIYEFAVEQDTSVKLSHCPNMDPDIDWAAQDRQSLGLTQTCRQWRTEYLPIFKETNVEIPYYIVEQYLETFVQPQLRDGQTKKVVGNLILAIYEDFIWLTQPTVNILPLIEYCDCFPRLAVRFHTELAYNATDEIMLNALLNSHKNTTWSKYLQGAVSKVLVVNEDRVGALIEIVVKEEYEEYWMGGRDLAEGMQTCYWCSRVGFMSDDDEWQYRGNISVQGRNLTEYWLSFAWRPKNSACETSQLQ
jgi:hypothetical protein